MCPMPLTLTMLSVLVWHLGAYEAAPVFVAVFTAYSCLCGTGLFQAMRARGEPVKTGVGAGAGGGKDKEKDMDKGKDKGRDKGRGRAGSSREKGESRQVSSEAVSEAALPSPPCFPL